MKTSGQTQLLAGASHLDSGMQSSTDMAIMTTLGLNLTYQASLLLAFGAHMASKYLQEAISPSQKSSSPITAYSGLRFALNTPLEQQPHVNQLPDHCA
eukprot:9054382-Ditylum_brightwellii.AAC.1